MRQGKKPLIIGLVVGLLVGVVVGAVLAISLHFRNVHHRPRHFPILATIVVANQAVKAGTVLTYEVMAQRDVPEVFVTSSVVPPEESAQVVGKVLQVDLQQGDPILWSYFSEGPDLGAPSGEDAQGEARSPDSGG